MLPVESRLIFWTRKRFLRILIIIIVSYSLCVKVRSETMYGIVNDNDDGCDQLPRLCYSCATTRVQKEWRNYKDYFLAPRNFTQACGAEFNGHQVPTIECSSPCLTIVEQVYLLGTYVGVNYFRGCLEKSFKSRFVEENAKRHLIQSNQPCKSIPRNMLFARPKLPKDKFLLCFCACDKCNTHLNSCPHLHRSQLFVIVIGAAFFVVNLFVNKS